MEVTESRSKAAGERLEAWARVKAARAVLGAGRSTVLGFSGDGMGCSLASDAEGRRADLLMGFIDTGD